MRSGLKSNPVKGPRGWKAFDSKGAAQALARIKNSSTGALKSRIDMLQSFFVILWIVLVTAFFSILAIFGSLIDKKGELPHKIARMWSRSILAASRVKVTVKNLSWIDPGRSYIYMSNHQSAFDIPVLLAYLPVQFKWLAKAELFKIPVFGFAMRRAGYISIDRSNRRSAIKSLRTAAEMIRNGVSVVIFPEGTRSRDGKIRPFKKGGFVLAVDSGVPVVPVIIHGTREIMTKKTLRIKAGQVVLEIEKPIETADYNRKTKDQLLDKVGRVIREAFYRG